MTFSSNNFRLANIVRISYYVVIVLRGRDVSKPSWDPPLVIEVFITNQENECHVYVVGVFIFPLATIVLLDFGTV